MSLIHDTESVTLAERRDLIARFIAPDPHHPGVAHHQVRDVAVSVWALVAYYDAVGHDLNQVAYDYDITVEQVRAALAFYAEHVDTIDAYLRSRQVA